MENPGFLSEFQNSPDIQILLDMIHGKTTLTSGDLLEMLTMVDPVNTQDRIQVPDTFSLSPRRWLSLLVSASTCFHFCFFMTCFCFLFTSIFGKPWSVMLLFTSETRLTLGFQQCFTIVFCLFPFGYNLYHFYFMRFYFHIFMQWYFFLNQFPKRLNCWLEYTCWCVHWFMKKKIGDKLFMFMTWKWCTCTCIQMDLCNLDLINSVNSSLKLVDVLQCMVSKILCLLGIQKSHWQIKCRL